MKIFDIETNGFLVDLEQIHCAWVFDTETQIYTCYNSQNNGQKSIEDFLEDTSTGDLLAHYGIGFDYLAIRQLYPQWKPTGRLYDSVILSKLIWSNLKEQDFVRLRKRGGHLFPARLCGSHSLEAWGHRLGIYKGDFGKTADWSMWTQDMEDYCKQDVVVTLTLWEAIERKHFSPKAIELEHDFAYLIKRQEQFGMKFDEDKASVLEGVLSIRKAEVSDALQTFFPPWEHIVDPCFIPKVNNKSRGYVKGVPFVKRKQVTFNASSRAHIAERLTAVYGWKPTVFNENDGKPTIDEGIISSLPYPPAPLLNEYLMLTKRLAMLSVGRQAWSKRVVNGRMHGRVDTLGAVTGRCTHSNPNVAQVPAVRALYGAECRELFTVDKGYKMIGADASGLELRCLAHYMAAYDEGAYGEAVVNGDIHTENQVAAGLPTRDTAKTFIYGFL